MPPEQSNHKVYQQMVHFLNSLEMVRDITKLVRVFQLKILILSGFRPHIDACVKCGQRIDGKTRFSLKLGGLVCFQCPTTERSFMLISRGTIATMLQIEKSDWKHCLRLGFTSSVEKELKFVLNNFLIYHLEKDIKTAKYLELEETDARKR